ncbi:MAG TPA: DUF6484 domain-containing protein [Acetobacteraceae bacterium]|nr:DUF6484 domain-containing protein [Acetobacteraceae bacterium]
MPTLGPAEVVIGQIISVGADGVPEVDFPDNPVGAPVPALATARYDDLSPGRAVALMFLGGDRAHPLAIGVVVQPDAPLGRIDESDCKGPRGRLTLTAASEIVLQCGRASLVLTRAGKVLVRGAYVSLRSSGVQRITGASVQIN